MFILSYTCQIEALQAEESIWGHRLGTQQCISSMHRRHIHLVQSWTCRDAILQAEEGIWARDGVLLLLLLS